MRNLKSEIRNPKWPAVALTLLLSAAAWGADEDFSGEDWVVVQGAGATISKTASTVTASGIDRDASSYVYKDYTAGHFGLTMTHQFEIKHTGVTGGGEYGFWQLGNEVSNWGVPLTAKQETDDFILLRVGGTNLNLYIVEDGATADNTANFAISLNVAYFVTIERATNDWTITIRLTSHTGAVQMTETITGTEANTFRYLYALNSMNTGWADKPMAGYTKDLNLNESEGADPAALAWWWN